MGWIGYIGSSLLSDIDDENLYNIANKYLQIEKYPTDTVIIRTTDIPELLQFIYSNNLLSSFRQKSCNHLYEVNDGWYDLYSLVLSDNLLSAKSKNDFISLFHRVVLYRNSNKSLSIHHHGISIRLQFDKDPYLNLYRKLGFSDLQFPL
jgi:hypothetical protein